MNIRSLTRGDGVVIGAAVLLFIASFLDFYTFSVNCGSECPITPPNGWEPEIFPALPSIFLAGLIAAGLIVAAKFLPQDRQILGLELDKWGTALAVFAAWSALWSLFGGGQNLEPGFGMILALVALLMMSAAAVLTPRTPALKAALLPAPRPAQQQPYPGAQPYGAHPGTGYGHPGGQPQQPYGTQPYGAQPYEQAAAAPQPAAAQAAAPAQEFAPFWFAVPVTRPLYPEDGSPTPVAELTPGTWYLAVDQRGAALVAQTQDGRRGVLQDTAGIQRG